MASAAASASPAADDPEQPQRHRERLPLGIVVGGEPGRDPRAGAHGDEVDAFGGARSPQRKPRRGSEALLEHDEPARFELAAQHRADLAVRG